MKAIWNGAVLAESDDTVLVEGCHCFPASSVRREHLLPSNTRTMRSWKGEAHYCTLFVDGDASPGAAWHYPEPEEAAEPIRGRVAFRKGARIEA